MNTLTARIFALAILLVFTYGVQAQKGADASDKASAHIRQAMESRKIPGLAVAVKRGDKVILAQSFGYADLEHAVPVTTKSIFHIASVSKVFTAMATLKLYEQGKIGLDDRIGKHLPQLPQTWHAITVKQLLNHTSGISSFAGFDSIPCKVGKDVHDYQKGDVLLEVACLPLQFEPGSAWSYGDTGFYILILLIEKISQQSYESFLKQSILVPMQMNSTRVFSQRDIVTGRVHGYALENGKHYNARPLDVEEFGIISSVEDMINMHEAFASQKLFRKETLQLMCTPTLLTNGKVTDYGLGIGLTNYKGLKRYGHNGGGGLGFATSLTHFPDKNLTVVILCNADQQRGYIGELANEIAAYFF